MICYRATLALTSLPEELGTTLSLVVVAQMFIGSIWATERTPTLSQELRMYWNWEKGSTLAI